MSKQTRYHLNALFLLVLLGTTTAAVAQVDQQRAQAYFKEAQALCERDGGKLWGVSLCGPMVFTDAATKTIATSQPAPDAPRPGGLGYLNAPVTWGGTRWSAFMWAWIPHSDAQERGRLFIHELFHRIQPELKLTPGTGENDHLDTLDGRYWIQLEWRALSRALTSTGAARAAAIRDALAFRLARRTAFPATAIHEAAEEIREGLAEYTGIVVATSSTADAIALAVRRLAGAEQEINFVQRFHAASGPAYGLLLDAYAPGWTGRVMAADELAQMLTAAAKIEPARDAAASATRYHGVELRAAEEKREVKHKARVAELKARFVDGPVLIVPRPSSSAINTLGSTPIPDIGLVIMEYRATPTWGSLTATSGVLVLTKGAVLHLTAPFQTSSSTLSGEGWTITLAAGWTVRPGKRPGDFEIVKQQPEPTLQPSVTTDVVYGHKDGLALTLDVHRPARPNGAGIISIVSGGWQSSVELAQIFSQAYPPLIEKGFTVFAVRHGSRPRYPMSSIVADVRRSVRFIRQHAKEYGIDPNRIGVFGNSAGGHLALLLGTTGDSGDPSATDLVLRESSRVAAVVANYPPTDLGRWATQQPVFKLTEAEAAQFSPIRFVSSGSAPSLIVHGDADTAVPIDQGETMHAALTKAGVPASFIRIKGAGHGFEGAAPADLERAYAALMQWFEQHLRGAAK